MITNDKGIVELKHFILREVCRLAWEGHLTTEETEKIVYQVSPGQNRSTAAASIRRGKSSAAGYGLPWERIRNRAIHPPMWCR